MKSMVILVTGATSGIGRHAALSLAKDGHHVIAAGRRVAALESLVAEAKAAGARIDSVRIDVNDAQSIEAAVREIDSLTDGHGIDALVNNAGYGQTGPLETVGDRELRAQFETNVFGLMAMTRAFVPQMRARGFGRIVNIGSMGGLITFPFMGAYHATKYAVEALSDALRIELRSFGIHVSLVEPGAINTEFNDRAIATLDSVTTDNPASKPYAAALAKADQFRATFEKTAAGPDVVTRAIKHAVSARRPRPRYLVPFSAQFLVSILRALPTRIADAVMRSFLGIKPARLDAPKAALSA
jgi:short-subunit dehydrogenase